MTERAKIQTLILASLSFLRPEFGTAHVMVMRGGASSNEVERFTISASDAADEWHPKIQIRFWTRYVDGKDGKSEARAVIEFNVTKAVAGISTKGIDRCVALTTDKVMAAIRSIFRRWLPKIAVYVETHRAARERNAERKRNENATRALVSIGIELSGVAAKRTAWSESQYELPGIAGSEPGVYREWTLTAQELSSRVARVNSLDIPASRTEAFIRFVELIGRPGPVDAEAFARIGSCLEVKPVEPTPISMTPAREIELPEEKS